MTTCIAWMATSNGLSQYDRHGHSLGNELGHSRIHSPSRDTEDYIRQAPLLSGRENGTGLLSSREDPRISKYSLYGYTSEPYIANSSTDTSLFCPHLSEYPENEILRPNQQEQTQPSSLEQQPRQFSSYEGDMLYNISGPSQTVSPYDAVQPYEERQPVTIEPLPSQFDIPQYFLPPEPAVGMETPYLTSIPSSAEYNHSDPNRPSSPGSSVPRDMDYATAIGNPQDQNEGQSPAAYLTNDVAVREAYEQFQSILMETFGHAHMGRLLEASQSLRKLSEWLATKFEELGV